MAHLVLFPFMSKGHTIPLIHLAHLLIRRGLSITIFTTHANSPFIRRSLGDTPEANARVIHLPFPTDVPQLPTGIESTDQLPSMSLLAPFFQATKRLQHHFDQALDELPRVDCVISDGFLGWSRLSASRIGVPWLVFYGMNTFATTVTRVVMEHRPHEGLKDDDEPFAVPAFPWIKLTKRDLNPPFDDPNPKGPLWDFVMESGVHTSQSDGFIINSFYEIEDIYVDYWNKEFNDPKVWCVGPLCLAVLPSTPRSSSLPKPKWVEWLDQKLTTQRPVLYIAFGTQADVSAAQLQEIAVGLERSEVDFLWVVRSKVANLGDGFEARVAERGLVVREWMEQTVALEHESVRGFMGHCGWNSVLESICAGVPILAWPMMAEQPMNAKLIVDELGIGLRVRRGGKDGLVGSDEVEKMVRELMVGEKGRDAREKMKEVGQVARRSMEEGGSSWNSLDLLLEELKLSKSA